MKTNVYVLMFVTIAVVGVSCLPSRQRRQFDWAIWENNGNSDFNRRSTRQTNSWESDFGNQGAVNQFGRQLPGNTIDFSNWDPLGDSVVSTASTASTTQGTTTTRAPATFRRCVEACQATAEYNPVCGTDGNTYQNAQRLSCARSCGQTVQLLRGGTCLPL